MARTSTCYDVLNESIFDGQIAGCKTSEESLALKHLEKPKQKDLFIYDRNYGSTWFMYYHIVGKRDFLMRMPRNLIKEIDLFFDSNEKSKILEIKRLPHTSKKQLDKLRIGFKSFKIRLVKIILDNGEVEVLATSLLDEEKYSLDDFNWLYQKRWGIETNYNHLKNHLQVEDFTGLSTVSVKQDFFASMFIINIQAIIIKDAEDELEKENKETEYKYKINKNLSLGLMKDRVMQIFCSDDPNYYEHIKNLFKIERVPIRPGRKNERVDRWNRRKYHMNQKRAI